MTAAHRAQLDALKGCRLRPGGWEKRFLRDLDRLPASAELTAGQRNGLDRLAHRYRAQLGRCMATGCEACAREEAFRRAPPPARPRGQRAQAEAELRRLLDEHNERWG